MNTVYLFRMFGNGTNDVQTCDSETANILASESAEYYASRGGLVFAAELCLISGIPSYVPYFNFKATDVQSREATEISQEIFG